MPWVLKRRGKGWGVQNKTNGMFTAHHPMTRANAEAQFRLLTHLYADERGEELYNSAQRELRGEGIFAAVGGARDADSDSDYDDEFDDARDDASDDDARDAEPEDDAPLPQRPGAGASRAELEGYNREFESARAAKMAAHAAARPVKALTEEEVASREAHTAASAEQWRYDKAVRDSEKAAARAASRATLDERKGRTGFRTLVNGLVHVGDVAAELLPHPLAVAAHHLGPHAMGYNGGARRQTRK